MQDGRICVALAEEHLRAQQEQQDQGETSCKLLPCGGVHSYPCLLTLFWWGLH